MKLYFQLSKRMRALLNYYYRTEGWEVFNKKHKETREAVQKLVAQDLLEIDNDQARITEQGKKVRMQMDG